tara:strand:+ start:4264 stop:5319 length:1056 start_codon:yes stop_codon:yes gene_type:complete
MEENNMNIKSIVYGLALASASVFSVSAETTVSYVSPSADITTGPGQTLIGVAEALEKMDGFKFFSATPPAHNDPAAFDRILSDQVVLAPDYLMVTPATSMDDIYDRLNEASAKGTELIIFSPLLDFDKVPIDPISYIVVPEDEMGRMAGRDIARMACESKRDPVNLAMFHGIPTSEIGKQRSGGFMEAITEELKKCGVTLNIVNEVFTNFSRELAFKTIEPVMTANPEINVVFGANSNTALGVMEGLQAIGKTPGKNDIWIAGQGGQLDELAAVCRGEIMSVPFRDPRKMSDIALDVMKKHMDGQGDSIEKVIFTQLVPITNCDQIFETVPRAMLESKGFKPLIPASMWQD